MICTNDTTNRVLKWERFGKYKLKQVPDFMKEQQIKESYLLSSQ